MPVTGRRRSHRDSASAVEVFVSYNRRDRLLVEAIVEQLGAEAVRVWFDQWNLVPGEPWQEAIEKALRKCDACAVFVGGLGTGPWQHEEMRSAIHRRVTSPGFRVIPAFLPGAPAEPVGLSDFLMAGHAVRFETHHDREALRLLVAGIRGIAPGASSTHTPAVVVYEAVISISFPEANRSRIEAIFEHLRKFSLDADLTLKAVREGSVVLVLEGQPSGCDRLKELLRRGQLGPVLGSSILEIRSCQSVADDHDHLRDRVEEREGPSRRARPKIQDVIQDMGAASSPDLLESDPDLEVPVAARSRSEARQAGMRAEALDEAALPVEGEIEWLERAQRGDPAALQQLLQAHLPRLRRWTAGRIPRSAGLETDDLVQDAVLLALRRLEGLEVRTPAILQQYLRLAVTNRIRDAVRLQRRRPEPVGLPDSVADPAPSPLEQAIGAENLHRYETAIQRLRPRDRQIIVGHVELQHSYEELAEMLGQPSVSAARMAVGRAMKRLAELLRHDS